MTSNHETDTFEESCNSAHGSITNLFRQAGTDKDIANELYRVIRERFRRIGAARKRELYAGDSLPTDAMVDDVFLKLLRKHPEHWQNREHIIRTAAIAMQHMIINHLRRRRLHGAKELFSSGTGIADPHTVETEAELSVQDSLARLNDSEPQWATVVRLKHFGHMTYAEIAREMELTTHQVESRYQLAVQWLRRDLSRDDGGKPL